MRIEIAGTITLEDVRRAYRTMSPVMPKIRFTNGQSSWRGWLLPLICLVVLVALSLFSFVQGGVSWNPERILRSVYPLIVVTVIGLVLVFGGFYLFAMYRRWRALQVDIPQSYLENALIFQQAFVFDDLGFVLKTEAGGEMAYSWEDIHSCYIDRQQILLLEKDVKNLELVRRRHEKPRLTLYHILPRHLFTDAQFRELSEFLERRISTPSVPVPPLPSSSDSVSSDGIRPANAGVMKPPSANCNRSRMDRPEARQGKEKTAGARNG